MMQFGSWPHKELTAEERAFSQSDQMPGILRGLVLALIGVTAGIGLIAVVFFHHIRCLTES